MEPLSQLELSRAHSKLDSTEGMSLYTFNLVISNPIGISNKMFTHALQCNYTTTLLRKRAKVEELLLYL